MVPLQTKNKQKQLITFEEIQEKAKIFKIKWNLLLT